MNNHTVEVVYKGTNHLVPVGTTVEEFLLRADGAIEDTVLAALANRRQVMLDFPLRGKVEVEPVHYGTRQGEHVYKRSVSLMLYEACLEEFPGARLVIGQSLGNSYHFQVRGQRPAYDVMARTLEERMREIHHENRRFTRTTVTIEEVEDFFRQRGCEDKLSLLGTRRSSTVHTITCGRFVDIAHGPYAPRTGCLKTFGVVPFGEGILLRFPRRANRHRLPPLKQRSLLYSNYVETLRWQELLGVRHVGELNRICLAGEVVDIIRVSEGLHEKKMAAVADEISSRKGEARLILVAGPSSSGKTTFIKRLAIQLRVNGIEPVGLSLDNYYVNRADTPLDEDGHYDFESIESLDLPLFHQQLADLLAGKEVLTPRYDFVAGLRKPEDKWSPMRLERDQVLLIEGIHGLNDRLTESVDRSQKFKIFISALTQLAIDDHNRIFTADARLIRRIVRDRLFRGFTTERTLDLWERVRRGEGRWIFPFQEEADVMFNSALVYEQAVLKIYAERFLLQVPRTSRAYTEAYRLLKFLSLFVPVFPDEVPHTSILREFIGDSSFEY